MGRIAAPARSVRHPAGFGFRGGYELVDLVISFGRLHDEHEWNVRQGAHRSQIGLHIERRATKMV